MLTSLYISSLMMGIVGGPHCLAMCGAACTALTHSDRSNSDKSVPQHTEPLASSNSIHAVQFSATPSSTPKPTFRLPFHLGRLAGYALLGAIAAMAMQSLAWLTAYTAVLRPLWSLFHALVLAWGIVLILFARQPIWLEESARLLWHKLQPFRQSKQGLFSIGMMWSLMPCGLLYSALLLASFQGDIVSGALSMAAFALGSGVSLWSAPWLWSRLNARRLEPYAMRITGVLLSVSSGWAIWMQLMHQQQVWCLS